MKQVAIKFMGPIRRPAGMGVTTRLSLRPQDSLEDVLRELGYSDEERSRLRVMVDGNICQLSDRVGENDELTIFLPLGGG